MARTSIAQDLIHDLDHTTRDTYLEAEFAGRIANDDAPSSPVDLVDLRTAIVNKEYRRAALMLQPLTTEQLYRTATAYSSYLNERRGFGAYTTDRVLKSFTRTILKLEMGLL